MGWESINLELGLVITCNIMKNNTKNVFLLYMYNHK